jgi:diguanylate cyclase
MGIGIWSMHFVGMLAFHLPIAMAYDPWITLASMVIAVVVSGFALFTVSRNTLTWERLAVAGTIMGLGIASMHYTGMAAMRIAPGIEYDPHLLTASIAIAIVASCAALWLAFALRSAELSFAVWKKVGSASVMGAAIVGMHYTGMAAAAFAPGAICTAPSDQVNSLWLAAAVAGFSMLLLVGMMVISAIDGRLVRGLEIANQRVLELATADALTGLANRRAFLDRLAAAFSATKRGAKPFALLLIDLDHFKDANDTLGHPAGDKLLCEVARRMTKTARQTDLVARLGGDEFAILQMDITDLGDAGTLAARIAEALGAHCVIDGADLHVTASIGVAACGEEIADPDALLMQADLALYRAKEEGRNCFRLYTTDLDRDVHERVTLAEDLRLGIERNELELVYQPQVDLVSKQIIGLEALVRWNHPRDGLIMPGVFVPIAERTGTIVALGRWALNEACRQLRQWHDQGITTPVVAVNVSALQLRGPSDLEHDIIDSLSRWNIRPSEIEVELTESVLMEAVEKYGEIIERIRQLGIRIAIDDFGTGYSSLNYLSNYPVTRLKIAQQLMMSATTDARHATVVKAAIRLAHDLGIEVLAEGVETEAHAKFLIDADCGQAQGYHFGRPVSAEQAAALLHQPAVPAMAPRQDVPATIP